MYAYRSGQWIGDAGQCACVDDGVIAECTERTWMTRTGHDHFFWIVSSALGTVFSTLAGLPVLALQLNAATVDAGINLLK
jgi:hypothetical protein